MKRKKLTLLTLLLSGGMSIAFAQRGTVAAGGNAIGAGGSVSYSIGQTDYTTVSSSGGKMYLGNQQPIELFVITGLDVKKIDLDLSVYPNPTFGNLTLKVSDMNFQNLNYSLVGIDGKIIAQQQIKSELTSISTGELAKGIYIVNIIESNTIIKSYNIVKN